jgi:hypothetical protein
MNRIAKGIVIVMMLIALCCGSLMAQNEAEKSPATSVPSKQEARSATWYRIQIAINEMEDGKKINTRNYSMDTEDNGRQASMKVGSRLPVPRSSTSSDSWQYIDVGLEIECWIGFREGYHDNKLGLTTVLDMSSVVDANQAKNTAPGIPIIRHLRSGTNTAVVLGKPMLIASIEDPTLTNRKYTIEATVTKLNP